MCLGLGFDSKTRNGLGFLHCFQFLNHALEDLRCIEVSGKILSHRLAVSLAKCLVCKPDVTCY